MRQAHTSIPPTPKISEIYKHFFFDAGEEI
jgi:hypothetical protein